MRFNLKICGLLLAVLCLAGCGAPAAETTAATTEAPETTEATEATVATTAPTPITTQEALEQALERDGRVQLEGDIQLTTGVTVKDRLLDGAGYSLTGPVYNEEDIETACGVFLSKGFLENLTVTGAYRAIGTNSNHRIVGDIRLTNVVADGENCALYVGHGDGKSGLNVYDSTLRGQTVFNRVTYAMFEGCTFTFNASGTKGNMTAYTDTTLVGCRFEGIEGKRYTLAFAKSVDNFTMTLEDCYVGDTLITQENIRQLLTVKEYANRIQVHNTIGG